MYEIITLEKWEIIQNRIALSLEDVCGYYMSYDPSSDLTASYEKQTINNLKISKEDLQQNPNRAYYKERSIKIVAEWLINTINKYSTLLDYLWVPAQSSKVKSDKFYDDRLQKILALVKKDIPQFNWFDALGVKQTVEKSRHSNNRNVQEKLNNLEIDNAITRHLNSKKIVLFDDVITTGASFKAAQIKIKEIDIDLHVIGIFIAKTVRPNS